MHLEAKGSRKGAILATAASGPDIPLQAGKPYTRPDYLPVAVSATSSVKGSSGSPSAIMMEK